MAQKAAGRDLDHHVVRRLRVAVREHQRRGAKPKGISDALGHASVVFTMDTYSYIISGIQEDMMALLDDMLPAGNTRVNDKTNAKFT